MAYREFATPNMSRRSLLRGGAWLTAGAALAGTPMGRVAMAREGGAAVPVRPESGGLRGAPRAGHAARPNWVRAPRRNLERPRGDGRPHRDVRDRGRHEARAVPGVSAFRVLRGR